MMIRRHKKNAYPVANAKAEVAETNDDEIKIYSKRAFNGMSVDKILELAKERGYEITATEKNEIVEQFLVFQG